MVQRICCGNGNCYLVLNGKDAILVDTGREKYRQKILDFCKPYNVRLLVLTHGHLDHIQNAAFLSKALGCPAASMLYNDRNMMLQSTDRISSLGERQIYFGHGKPKKNRSSWR